MTEGYIAQVSGGIQAKVSEKLTQEFSRTESRNLGALSKLDNFLLNPQVRICSVAVPGTSRNNDTDNWKPTADRSLNDPYPEVEFSIRQASTSADSDRRETYHKTQSRDSFYRSCLEFTYPSMILTSCKNRASNACSSGVLIQIVTEQLWNKQILIYFPHCKFISLKGFAVITNLGFYYKNPPFFIISAVI